MRGKKLAQKKLKNTGNPVFIGKQNDIPTRTRHSHNLARYHWLLHLKKHKNSVTNSLHIKKNTATFSDLGFVGFYKTQRWVWLKERQRWVLSVQFLKMEYYNLYDNSLNNKKYMEIHLRFCQVFTNLKIKHCCYWILEFASNSIHFSQVLNKTSWNHYVLEKLTVWKWMRC